MGALNYAAAIPFPRRSHVTYIGSDAARRSPLTQICGFHVSTVRSEAMHVGPMDVLPDAVGSAMLTLADEGIFGCTDFSPWAFRLGAQLSIAFKEFALWCKQHKVEHTFKGFSVKRFGLFSLNYSWPVFKGKAHNRLVIVRWLDSTCAESAHMSKTAMIRSQVMAA